MFDNEAAHKQFELDRELEKTDIWPEYKEALEKLSIAADNLIESSKKLREYAARCQKIQ